MYSIGTNNPYKTPIFNDLMYMVVYSILYFWTLISHFMDIQ